eukprot:749866-Hanusia_phi.AAC.2
MSGEVRSDDPIMASGPGSLGSWHIMIGSDDRPGPGVPRPPPGSPIGSDRRIRLPESAAAGPGGGSAPALCLARSDRTTGSDGRTPGARPPPGDRTAGPSAWHAPPGPRLRAAVPQCRARGAARPGTFQ